MSTKREPRPKAGPLGRCVWQIYAFLGEIQNLLPNLKAILAGLGVDLARAKDGVREEGVIDAVRPSLRFQRQGAAPPYRDSVFVEALSVEKVPTVELKPALVAPHFHHSSGHRFKEGRHLSKTFSIKTIIKVIPPAVSKLGVVFVYVPSDRFRSSFRGGDLLHCPHNRPEGLLPESLQRDLIISCQSSVITRCKYSIFAGRLAKKNAFCYICG